MKNRILIIILIINSIFLFSCAKNKKLEAVKHAKDFENKLVDAIKKNNFKDFKEDKKIFNIIDAIDSCEQICKKADTVYKINREYLLQTAAINDRDSILNVLILSGVDHKAKYVIKNDFDIDKEKKELTKKDKKEYTNEEVINKIKEKNKKYVAYYENIGASFEYNIRQDTVKLKAEKQEIRNILGLKITIENYAFVMSKILGKEKSFALLSKYNEAEETNNDDNLNDISDIENNLQD